MSWKEKIDLPFRITTGDGVTYTPLLDQANSLSIDMLASSFEFSGIDGSLVKRKATSGRTFPLSFFFTGDNHLDNSDDFVESAQNKKPWTIQHPKYGELYVQPISIKRDDSTFNRTLFSVEVRETINQSYPNSTRSKNDTIRNFADNVNLTAAQSYGLAVKDVSTEDKLVYKQSISNSYEQYKQDVISENDSSTLENLYQKSLTAVDNTNISGVQEFVQAPVNFGNSLGSRLSQLSRAYNQITDLSTLDLKEYFQAIGASILAGMCLSSIQPNEDDYSRRKDIDLVIKTIQDTYHDYISTLDNIQDENLSLSESFNVDPEVIQAVDRMVKETIANLNEVIFGALVENIFVVQYPTNLILVTHHLIGRVTDETIDEMMKVNDFSRDEIIQLRKGQEIVYYA